MRSTRAVLATVTSATVAAVLAIAGSAAADPLELVTYPTIAGTPAVGSTLDLTPPTWSLPDIVDKVQWLRDGAVIKIDGRYNCQVTATDACPYLTTVEDAGHNVQARVTGSLSSELPGVQVLSNVIAIPADDTGGGGGGSDGGTTTPVPVPIPIASQPVIAGTPKVGQTIAVDTGTNPIWALTGVTETDQWLLGTDPIPGATETSYTVQPADVGQQISFRAAGTLDPAHQLTFALSDPVTALPGDAPIADPAPALLGTYAVGQTLSVEPGEWGTVRPDPTFTYEWRRDETAIPGATAPEYQLTRLDAGHTVSLLLTAQRPGYQDGTAAVAGAPVPMLASGTVASLLRPKIRKGTHGVVNVRVTVPGLPAPGGSVAIYDGARLLKTLRLPATGTLSVKLPTLTSGVHRIRARYLGSTGVLASPSKLLRLTVLA